MSENLTCGECGEALETGRYCTACRFWLHLVAEADDPRNVRAGGQHYRLGDPRPSKKHLRALGGRRFIVTYADGHTVKTSNLWVQGPVPERFRDRLPDNATLESDEPDLRSNKGVSA